MASDGAWNEFLDLVRECIRAGAPKDKLIGDMVKMVPPMEGIQVREALEVVFREMEIEVYG